MTTFRFIENFVFLFSFQSNDTSRRDKMLSDYTFRRKERYIMIEYLLADMTALSITVSKIEHAVRASTESWGFLFITVISKSVGLSRKGEFSSRLTSKYKDFLRGSHTLAFRKLFLFDYWYLNLCH